MRTIDAIEHIRKNPDMYVPEGQVTSSYLATRLAGDALLLGAGRVEISRAGNWWYVAADWDWIDGNSDDGVQQVFSRVLPFPQAGVNAIRTEVLISAFANVVVTSADGRCATIKGDPDERAAACEAPGPASGGRVVAFKVDDDQE